eukprot:m.1452072 g.1452072  ORF g.1452072 m.1452072 type:complete len:71 (-) comp25117_c1_seq10:2961-3173(-)
MLVQRRRVRRPVVVGTSVYALLTSGVSGRWWRVALDGIAMAVFRQKTDAMVLTSDDRCSERCSVTSRGYY